jgi:branched-chain amino acid transport system permease protein
VFDWFNSNEALIQSALALTILGFSVQLALRAGVFSLAGVGFWAIGGYSVANLVGKHDWPTPLAIAVTVGATLVPAFLLALILRKLRALYLAMATFAFVLIVQVAALNWDSVTGGAVGLFAIPVTVSTLGLTLVVIACAAGIFVWERGRHGRVMESLREDERLASALGVDVPRERVIVFTVSAGLGTLSGSLNALMFNTLTADQAGFGLITTALMVIVLGGTQAWWGPIAGAVIVTWLPEVLRFADDYREVIQGAIVVLVVVYAPDGMVGAARAIRRRLPRSASKNVGARAREAELGASTTPEVKEVVK